MSEANRLVACRACGNRVARDARRCPACGAREPTAERAEASAPAPPLSDAVPAADRPPTQPQRETADSRRAATPPSQPKKEPFTAPKRPRTAPPSRPPRRTGRRRRVLAVTLTVLVLATAAGLAAIYLTTPPLPPALQTAAVPAPATVAPPQPVLSAPMVPSRSRGRADWLFFFRPGDWLTRMNDEALLGIVVRVEKSHTFEDGSSGPAYVVQSMEGEERVLDADELERTARLR